MEDFPQRKLFGAGDTPSAELPQAKGDTIMNEWFLLSSLWSANTADSYLPMPQQTTFQEVSLVSADERQVYLRAIVSRCSADYTKALAIQTTNFPDESSYSHRDTKKVTCQSEITQLHFPLQRNATFTSQTTLCQVFTCYGQFPC